MITAADRIIIQSQVEAITPAVLNDDLATVKAWMPRVSRRAWREAGVIKSGKPQSSDGATFYLIQSLQTPAYLELAQHARVGNLECLNEHLRQEVDSFDANWALTVALSAGRAPCVDTLWPQADLYHPDALLTDALTSSAPFPLDFIETMRQRLMACPAPLNLPDAMPFAARKNRKDVIEAWLPALEADERLDASLCSRLLMACLDNGHQELGCWLMDALKAQVTGMTGDGFLENKVHQGRLESWEAILAARHRATRAGHLASSIARARSRA